MSEKAVILYVDDEPLNLMIFEKNFEKTYKVLTADSGFQGLDRLNDNQTIKAVVSDMKMPGMNGVEFVRKAKIKYPEVAFFILTGFEITEEIADALNDRVVSKYFRKPFNVREIESAIIAAISG